MNFCIANLLNRFISVGLRKTVGDLFSFFLKPFSLGQTLGRVLSIVLVFCLAFSGSALGEEGDEVLDIWGEEVVITCDNVLQVFEAYHDTVILTGTAFTKALSNMEELLKLEKHHPKREEAEAGFSETSGLVYDNSDSLNWLGLDILQTMRECLAEK